MQIKAMDRKKLIRKGYNLAAYAHRDDQGRSPFKNKFSYREWSDVLGKRLERGAKILDLGCRNCAQWLKEKGVQQWGHYLTEEPQALIDRRFREGEAYMAVVEDRDAAVIVLQWEDSFWGERGEDPAAGFLHSIAVHRSFAGRRLGVELIEWAIQTA